MVQRKVEGSSFGSLHVIVVIKVKAGILGGAPFLDGAPNSRVRGIVVEKDHFISVPGVIEMEKGTEGFYNEVRRLIIGGNVNGDEGELFLKKKRLGRKGGGLARGAGEVSDQRAESS